MYGEEDTKVSENSISTDSVTISSSCTLQNLEILATLAMKLSREGPPVCTMMWK